jgi:NAD(P)-dependent dehydrogenase (short-subunit alcohol dehydrogenase family)
MNLHGKVALITGGGTGIGAAVARRFVSDGAKVCIAGRGKELLDQVAGSLPSESATICSGDVSRYEDVERMVESALTFGGRLNVLVNNAGMDQNPPANVIDINPKVFSNHLPETYPYAEWRPQMRSEVFAVILPVMTHPS